LFNVFSADSMIVASDEFRRSRCMRRCAENMLHLMSVGQWMQISSGGCGHRGSRRVTCGQRVCVSRRLKRSPGRVTQCLPAHTAVSEHPRGVDGVAWAHVSWALTLENPQDLLRALSGISGDFTKVLHAQNELARLLRHVYNPRPPR
jgi:hypothetical protein